MLVLGLSEGEQIYFGFPTNWLFHLGYVFLLPQCHLYLICNNPCSILCHQMLQTRGRGETMGQGIPVTSGKGHGHGGVTTLAQPEEGAQTLVLGDVLLVMRDFSYEMLDIHVRLNVNVSAQIEFLRIQLVVTFLETSGPKSSSR